MTKITVNLQAELSARLKVESDAVGVTPERFVVDAIRLAVQSAESTRFCRAIAQAARAEGGENPIAIAEEALPFDNESLFMSERSARRAEGAGKRNQRVMSRNSHES